MTEIRSAHASIEQLAHVFLVYYLVACGGRGTTYARHGVEESVLTADKHSSSLCSLVPLDKASRNG